jgi:hypothetical protein
VKGSRAAMCFADPPYNVRMRDIVGRGQVKHAEFAMASGELSRPDFVSFLKTSLEAAASVSANGAVHRLRISQFGVRCSRMKGVAP